jgi:hypothetical protein
VFYVRHVDKSSLHESLFHCNILSKHHHHHIQAPITPPPTLSTTVTQVSIVVSQTLVNVSSASFSPTVLTVFRETVAGSLLSPIGIGMYISVYM